MEVEVRYVGEYQQVAGTRKDTVEVPDDAVLGDVLTLLAQRYGVHFTQRVFTDSGELRDDCWVYVGEDPAQSLDGLDTPLRTGEQIKLMFVGSIMGGELKEA